MDSELAVQILMTLGLPAGQLWALSQQSSRGADRQSGSSLAAANDAAGSLNLTGHVAGAGEMPRQHGRVGSRFGALGI